METWYDLISQYGYVAIVIVFTLGIVGLPIPDEILLTYLGFVTSIGKMHFGLIAITAFLGASIGISISYFLGHKLGEPFLRKFGPKLFIKEKAIDRTNKLFNKYGAFVLFVCYFIPGIRHVAAYLAGITHFPFKRFCFYAYAGALFWVMLFLIIGNRLGENWNLIIHYFHEYIWIVIIVIVIACLIAAIYYVRYRIKGKR